MKNFKYFNKNTLLQYTKIRSGETKFGEKMSIKSSDQELDTFLLETESTFVIYGINESIGVAANYGRTGTESAFESALSALCNIQNNKLCKGSWVAVLGFFDFTDYQNELSSLDVNNSTDRKKLNDWVIEIDKQITHLNSKIIQSGKIPIIIGGGHNNSYGNIKGLSLANNKSVNVVNFDAHTDFRALEGRHSGNGFSYAFDQDFLHKYFIFGIHENYISKHQFSQLKEFSERINYVTYEEIEVREERNFKLEIQRAKEFIKNRPYGIEIDLDAIENISSSAISPSGFSVKQARNFVHVMANHNNASYLHLCESAPSLDSNSPTTIGKLISYLITDFIKSKKNI